MKRVLALILAAGMLLTMTGCHVMDWLQEKMILAENERFEQEILENLQSAERFEITDADGTVLLTQADLEKAEAMWYSMNYNEDPIPAVHVTFNAGGAKKFADATMRYRGYELVFLLDGQEVVRSTVNEPITDGVMMISGGNIDSYEKAAELAARMESTIQ